MAKINKKIEDLVAEYLSGEISDSRLAELEKLTETEGFQLEDFIKIHQELDLFDIPEPGSKMDENFNKMLKEQKQLIENQSNRWLILWEKITNTVSFPGVPRPAYGLILLLIGLVLGNILLPNRGYERQIEGMSKEIGEMRKVMVLTMIDGRQATDRIMAVSYVNEMDKVDNSVIDALFKTLNNDENVNVRLASLDALIKFTRLAQVRQGMIESLKNQESPMVLMELASVLIQIQEKKSVPELKNLLKKQDLDPSLRLTIEKGIQTLI